MELSHLKPKTYSNMKRFVFNKTLSIGFPTESWNVDISMVKEIMSLSIDSYNYNNWQHDEYDGQEESIGYKVFPNGLQAVSHALVKLKKEDKLDVCLSK
jgi:hypothetical protein